MTSPDAVLDALRISEERLRMAVHAAGIGIWEWRLDDDRVYWSPEYRDIYGHGPDVEPTFATGMSVVHPEDVPRIEASMREALTSGREFGVVHRVRHPTRGLRYVQSIGRCIADADGRPERVSGIVTDVTEQQHDADAMRRLHAIASRPIRRDETIDELMAEVLEAALAITGRERGVIRLVDASGEALVMSASRGFSEAFFDHRERLPMDAPVPSAIAWRLRKRLVIEDLAAEPGETRAGGAQLLLAEGVRAVQSTPLVSRAGAVLGVLTTHGNTPHSWTDRELRLLDMLSREAADFIERAQAEAQLKEADRRKDEFLAILAHELRNPLAPIRYSVTIAREAGTTPQQRRRAEEVIERQVAHMGRLLDDLLDVSRIARGTVQLQRKPVGLDGIVAAAAEAARPLVAAREHALEIRVPPGLVVDVDPVRLTQILTNLLNNAAKYTEPRGRIALAAEADGGDLVLRVADNGMGLAEDVRPRLFTLFTQAPGAVQRAEGGLGIGLALVKAFVELHGGTVAAHSGGPGQGSEFTIRLPAVVAPRAMRHMDESMETSTP